MELLLGIFTAFGLSASAGLNAYIPLLVVGVIAHYTDWITLSEPWDLLANPWVLIVLGILVIIEMLANVNLDKFEPRLKQLLQGFRWDRMDRVFLGAEDGAGA